jgi:hypothetical protein
MVDLGFFSVLFVGFMLQFYDARKTEAWLVNKAKGSWAEPKNTMQLNSYKIMAAFPLWVKWMCTFGLLSYIVFKTYDILKFEKTLLILLILIYTALTQKNINI